MDMSFVMIYQHHETRLPLLKASIDSLHFTGNDWAQFCLLEIGPKRELHNVPIPQGCTTFRYKFVKSTGLFNRGWAFNVAVQLLANREWLVLADADLIFPTNYISKVRETTVPKAGWSQIYVWSQSENKIYFDTKNCSRTSKFKIPTPGSAAGGVIVVPRQVFVEVQGFPEIFEGWGGEDNGLWSKLRAWGWPFQCISKCDLFHMWHPRTTPRSKHAQLASNMLKWKKDQWKDYHIKYPIWGSVDRIPETFYTDYVNCVDYVETAKKISKEPKPVVGIAFENGVKKKKKKKGRKTKVRILKKSEILPV